MIKRLTLPIITLALLLSSCGGFGARDCGNANVFENPSGERDRILQTDCGILAVDWAPDESLLATGSYSGTVLVWNPTTGERIYKLEHRSRGWTVNSVAFNPDGTVIAAGHDGSVVLWDVATGEQLTILGEHGGSIQKVDWSPDGSLLASASDTQEVIVWDVDTGERVASLSGHTGLTNVSWSPDGAQLVSGPRQGEIVVWDASTWDEIMSVGGLEDGVRALAWSPDGATIALGDQDGSVILWDAASGEQLAYYSDFTQMGEQILEMEWSPNSQQIAVGALYGRVRVLDVPTGRTAHALQGHTGWVYGVAWMPQTGRLTSGSTDGVISMWEIPSE